MDKAKNEKELNIIDRFLYKLIISVSLLFLVIVLDKFNIFNLSFENIKTELSDHFNVLEVIKYINGKTNALIPIDVSTDEVANNVIYTDMLDIKDGKRILLGSYEAVENIKAGIVVKIYKRNDFYEVTVKGADNLQYIYCNLEQVDVNIYEYLKSGSIIGKAKENDVSNYFDFYCYSKGIAIDYFA